MLGGSLGEIPRATQFLGGFMGWAFQWSMGSLRWTHWGINGGKTVGNGGNCSGSKVGDWGSFLGSMGFKRGNFEVKLRLKLGVLRG